MSDDPGSGQPPSKHDHTVELSGVELDLLRSSAELPAVKLLGDDVDETVKPEDATNPGMRTINAPAESAEDVSDEGPIEEPIEEPIEDATKSIDRASLKALTESQEFAAAKRKAIEKKSSAPNEDATKSIDRGALAHIIKAKGAPPKPFGIRKREKRGDGDKKAAGPSKPLKFKKGKLPDLTKLKPLESAAESPTAERERPHMTSLELPEPATRSSEASVPSLKLPSFARAGEPEPSEREALTSDVSSEPEYSLEEVGDGVRGEEVSAEVPPGQSEAEQPEAEQLEPEESEAAGTAPSEPEVVEAAEVAEVEESVEPEVAESALSEAPEEEPGPEQESEPEPTERPVEGAASSLDATAEVFEIQGDTPFVSPQEPTLATSDDVGELDAATTERRPPIVLIGLVLVLVLVVLIGIATRG